MRGRRWRNCCLRGNGRCKPAYFPVVVAAIRALGDRVRTVRHYTTRSVARSPSSAARSATRSTRTTNTASWAGWRANATIGRASQACHDRYCAPYSGQVFADDARAAGAEHVLHHQFEVGALGAVPRGTRLRRVGELRHDDGAGGNAQHDQHDQQHREGILRPSPLDDRDRQREHVSVLRLGAHAAGAVPRSRDQLAEGGYSKQGVKEFLFQATSRIPLATWPAKFTTR